MSSGAGPLRAGWRLALGTLTIWPSGPVEPTPAAARVMVALAPVAVIPVAAGAAAIALLGSLSTAPDLVIGFGVLAWLAATTRMMHLDALADVADGLGAGWRPERARAVLKRGDTGAMGVATLILALGLQAASIAALTRTPAGWLLIGVAVAVSRWFLAPLCWGVPAMPGSTLGIAYAGALPRWQVLACGASIIAVLSAASRLAGSAGWWGLGAGIGGLAAVWALRAHTRRRFEGMNGDMLGAGIEVGLTVLLVVLACR